MEESSNGHVPLAPQPPVAPQPPLARPADSVPSTPAASHYPQHPWTLALQTCERRELEWRAAHPGAFNIGPSYLPQPFNASQVVAMSRRGHSRQRSGEARPWVPSGSISKVSSVASSIKSLDSTAVD